MATARDLLVVDWVRQRVLERGSGTPRGDQNHKGETL
ncbi:uncharacterized protein METZ01_LOCUS201 [marine metagenome]|uniref:Uncharacterized protein n=1 Tax=marine metagenome TaxID=408172 RepID=A0A381MYH2_9ZZZZ